MKTTSAVCTLGCLAISLLLCPLVQAQDELYFVRSMGVVKALQHAPGERHPGERNLSKPGERQVAMSNMDLAHAKAARLRAMGNSDVQIHRTLVPANAVVATGSIEGVLYKSDGVTPVSSYMSVGAFNEFGVYAGYGYAMSSPGVYKIQNLPTGKYYVQLNWSGIGDVVPVYYKDVEDWRQATLVQVTDGFPTTGINFRCRPYPSGGGTIAGTVFDADSVPVAQCRVIANGLFNSSRTGSQLTDNTGRFMITGLLAGDYKICAQSPLENYLDQWYDRAGAEETAAVIHVNGMDTVDGIDFYLERAGVISGIVAVEGGGSIPANACNIVARDLNREYVSEAQNTADGTFAITGLPTGDYTLQFSCYGMENYSDGWYDRVGDAAHATPVHVTAAETTAVTIRLQRGGVIAGKIVYAVPSGVAVTVCDETGEVSEQGRSGQDGTYAIPRLPAGRFKVFASTVQSSGFSGPQALDQWYSQSPDFEHAAFVDVRQGDTTKNIDFTLQPGGSIACLVVDRLSQPLNSGSVYLCDARGAVIRSASVHSGLCSLGGVRSGTYKLCYVSARNSESASEWYDGKTSAKDATLVTVTAPGPTQNVTFTLQGAGSLAGFVTDAGGSRLTDRNITVILYDAISGGYAGSSQTSFLSGFQGMFLPGSYKLGFFSRNLYSEPPVEDSLAILYYEHGKKFSDPGTTTLLVGERSSTKVNDCVMERATGSIAGILYDRRTGKPLVSGTSLLFAFDDEGKPVAGSMYGSDYAPRTGEYVLRGLWPGNYALLAVSVSASSDEEHAQWYDGVAVDIDSVMNVPMPIIPSGARFVTVGAGRVSGIDFHIGVLTDISRDLTAESPTTFSLSQNYPNPFNPSTTIGYCLPYRSRVAVTLFNVLGQQIAVLQDGEQEAGYHDIRFDASGLSSGVYYYRMQAASYVETRKLIVLR